MSPRAKVKKVIEVDLEVTPRDFVMARLVAARAQAQSAIDAIDDAVTAFVEPESDEDGKERAELVEAALESLGAATRALESAEEALPAVDNAECEPWDEDSDDEDGEADD